MRVPRIVYWMTLALPVRGDLPGGRLNRSQTTNQPAGADLAASLPFCRTACHALHPHDPVACYLRLTPVRLCACVWGLAQVPVVAWASQLAYQSYRAQLPLGPGGQQLRLAPKPKVGVLDVLTADRRASIWYAYAREIPSLVRPFHL
jgi:hypothetical protein